MTPLDIESGLERALRERTADLETLRTRAQAVRDNATRANQDPPRGYSLVSEHLLVAMYRELDKPSGALANAYANGEALKEARREAASLRADLEALRAKARAYLNTRKTGFGHEEAAALRAELDKATGTPNPAHAVIRPTGGPDGDEGDLGAFGGFCPPVDVAPILTRCVCAEIPEEARPCLPCGMIEAAEMAVTTGEEWHPFTPGMASAHLCCFCGKTAGEHGAALATGAATLTREEAKKKLLAMGYTTARVDLFLGDARNELAWHEANGGHWATDHILRAFVAGDDATGASK